MASIKKLLIKKTGNEIAARIEKLMKLSGKSHQHYLDKIRDCAEDDRLILLEDELTCYELPEIKKQVANGTLKMSPLMLNYTASRSRVKCIEARSSEGWRVKQGGIGGRKKCRRKSGCCGTVATKRAIVRQVVVVDVMRSQ